MTTASQMSPQRTDTVVPMLDLQPYESALSWLERVRRLLEDSGGWTVEDQRLINTQARSLLVGATTPMAPALVVQLPSTPATPDAIVLPVTTPRSTPVPQPSRNGHQAAGTTQERWSLNERLQALGYPEEVTRSNRIKVGHAVVERYRQTHGKAPMIADRGSGAQAKRVSLYEAADLPMVDAMIRDMLGDPETVEPVGETES